MTPTATLTPIPACMPGVMPECEEFEGLVDLGVASFTFQPFITIAQIDVDVVKAIVVLVHPAEAVLKYVMT